jgi:hypothetical protein
MSRKREGGVSFCRNELVPAISTTSQRMRRDARWVRQWNPPVFGGQMIRQSCA